MPTIQIIQDGIVVRVASTPQPTQVNIDGSGDGQQSSISAAPVPGVANISVNNNVPAASVFAAPVLSRVSVSAQGLLIQNNNGDTFVFNEIPTGLINNVNNIFHSLQNFKPGTVVVFVNGLEQTPITDFITTGNTQIILTDSLLLNDRIKINYQLLN